jgi:hypothetical protein
LQINSVQTIGYSAHLSNGVLPSKHPMLQASTYKIPNPKHPATKMAGKQITNQSQIPIFNEQNV